MLNIFRHLQNNNKLSGCTMKKRPLYTALLSLGMVATGTSVYGEDDQFGSDLSLETLLATGFRASLIKAIEAKREARGAQDTIVAEDIADFPDLNLAESIQRMPGVAINREGGEGRQIALRGIGSTFTRVQINGMETMAKTTSPMDSRSKSNDRAFDFSVFASEMFAQIDIYKSYSANLDEGGIGGTVGLTTPKPFDFDSIQLAANVSVGTNEYASDPAPRLTLMAADTWGNFGALFSLSYSERDTIEKGFNTFRWRQRSRNSTQYSDQIDADTAQLIEDGELWFARGNRYSVWENTQERLGVNVALQFQPIEDINLGFNYLHGELNNDRRELHLATSGSSSTALGFIEDLEYVDVNGDLEVHYGEFSDVPLRTETRLDEADTTFDQVVFDGDWQINDSLLMKGMLGWSLMEFDQPVLDKFYFQTREGQELITDFRGDKFDPKLTYGFDTTDPNNWELREFDIREDYYTQQFTNLKLDFIYEITQDVSLEAGISHKEFVVESFTFRVDDVGRNIPAPQNNDVRDITDLSFVYSESDDVSWLAGDVKAGQRFYGIETDIDGERTPAWIKEETLSTYIQANYDGQVGALPLRADFGLRFYNTDRTFAVTADDRNFTISGDNSKVLPAFNIALDITEDLVWRGSVSQNINRAQLDELRQGNISVNSSDNPDERTVSVGGKNLELEPYETTNIESSIEWYFSEVGFIALGFFSKQISGIPVEKTDTVSYSETGLPNFLLGDGESGSTQFEYTRLDNEEDATIRGFEISAQTEFDFLPAPFDKMGVLGNMTLVDGDFTYRNVQGTGETETKSFLGLSEVAGNLTLYYEQDSWGGRIAAAYRDDYISRVEAGLADEDERGFHSTLNVDFTAFYKINDNFKVSFEGINITNQAEEQYSDSNDRPYNITTSGATYYVGVTYSY